MGTSGGILSGDDAFVRLASTMGAGNGTSRVKGVALEDVVRGGRTAEDVLADDDEGRRGGVFVRSSTARRVSAGTRRHRIQRVVAV